MTVKARTSAGAFEIELELARADLLPGRLVDGALRITARHGGEIRGARVTLVGTERWRFDRVSSDTQGHTHTEIATGEEDLPDVPVAVLGATTFAACTSVLVSSRTKSPAHSGPGFSSKMSGFFATKSSASTIISDDIFSLFLVRPTLSMALDGRKKIGTFVIVSGRGLLQFSAGEVTRYSRQTIGRSV